MLYKGTSRLTLSRVPHRVGCISLDGLKAVPFREASFSAAFEAAVGRSLGSLGLVFLILRQG